MIGNKSFHFIFERGAFPKLVFTFKAVSAVGLLGASRNLIFMMYCKHGNLAHDNLLAPII